MNSFPLVFSFRDLVAGNGYVAAVEASGRIILEHDPDAGEWTLCGVNPGGIAGGAGEEKVAFADFRATFRGVLDDIAHEAANIEAFKAAVEAFVGQTNASAEAEWAALREQVRAGKLSLDLQRVDASAFVPQVIVRRVDGDHGEAPSPRLNPVETFNQAA